MVLTRNSGRLMHNKSPKGNNDSQIHSYWVNRALDYKTRKGIQGSFNCLEDIDESNSLTGK